MSALIGQTTRQFSTPYITVGEYKQAPTAVDYSNLVVDSADPMVQDAELSNVISRASSWVDTYCNQVLGATQETEQQRARLRSDGLIIVHPRYFPVVTVSDFWYGLSPNQLVQFPDPSQGWLEDQSIVIPYSSANLSYSTQGPLQFGLPAVPRQQVYVRYTYVSGFPSTVLAGSVAANGSTITVLAADGITAGARMTIYDGSSTEEVTVASSYVYGSTTVPLTAGVGFAHAAGVSVSALPPAVKQATILATSAFIKSRGDTSLTMDVLNTATNVNTGVSKSIASDWSMARELLAPFRRIR